MTTRRQITILNVDDEEPQRYVKSRDLRAGGFIVVEAVSGAEALRLAEQHRPEVILLDVQLPDISGLEVCHFIKDKWPQIMVLMTSATFTSADDRTLGLDSGADSYLVQPAEPLELIAGVNALLRIRQSEDELRQLNESLEQRIRDRVAELAEANNRLEAEVAQRQKTEAALVQAEKMQAVGQLTGGLAHDFNNLLTAVVGNLDLIRARSTDPRIQRFADNAFNAAQRGSKLTSQLLVFSRTQALATVPVDVNALILGMRELLNQSLGAHITVYIETDPRLPIAIGDTNQLELAVLNLAINARDAMPNGGTLVIRTTTAADDVNPITIEVTDSGVGMTSEVAARAFDPFFTTKPAGKGTGLGLSQVYGIVRQVGGDITIHSEIGKGTTVTLRLPGAADEAVAHREKDPDVLKARRSEKLLVVDDDPDVREVVSGFLSDLGYAVREAPLPDEGLAIMREFVPDLLILDFAMPGTNGAEMAVLARKLHPGLRILFLSGFADTRALEAAVGTAPLLRKPFRPVELAAAVQLALDA